jgi:hypothetical protein
MARRRMRGRSLAVALILATALCACTSGPDAGPRRSAIRSDTPTAAASGTKTTSRPPAPITPWGGSPVTGAAAHAEPVLGVGVSLYALGSRRLFRLDATTGSVVAQVSVANHVGALSDAVVAAATVWLSPTPDSAGRAVLTGYDPVTLAPVARIPLPATGSAGSGVLPLAGSPDGRRLYVALPHAVLGIDPVRRMITQRLDVAGGQLIDVAVSANARRLYVAVQPAATGTSIDVLDAGTGAVLFIRPSGNNVVNNTGLVSSAGGLWVQTGGGMSDQVTFYRGDSLRSPTDPGVYPQVGGRPITVTVSGSAVWVGADNAVACADPLTGHDRSHIALPPQRGSTVYLIDLIFAGGRLYGSYQDDTGESSMIVLTPPSRCTP